MPQTGYKNAQELFSYQGKVPRYRRSSSQSYSLGFGLHPRIGRQPTKAGRSIIDLLETDSKGMASSTL